jgi:trigger factor
MQKITRTNESDTKIVLSIVVDDATLAMAKNHTVEKLGKNVKVPGFRPGTAPASVIEKSLDQNALAEEFLNDVVNHSYGDALKAENINPIAPPKIEITKFIPFSLVEYTAEVTTLGAIKLADYTKLKSKKEVIAPDKADIEQVLDNMRTQLAEKKDVDRAAKNGDQVWINFEGKDSKGAEVKGAKGENYPLGLGSNTFIPGFEEHLVGAKAGDDKEFTITFPKDYGVKALQSKKVTFSVSVIKVQEVAKPELDDELVAKVAPHLKTVAELKDDIKRQLLVEADTKATRAYENALVAEIVAGSTVSVPDELVEEQAANVMRDLQQNIVYRGQTMEEYLEAIGMTAEEQREKEILPEANRRLKAGILLSEIAEKEKINVTPEEIKARVAVLKVRYQGDAEMQKQLEDANNQRELGAQIITEKTLAKIIGYNS